MREVLESWSRRTDAEWTGLLKKNDFHISPCRYVQISDADTCRPNAEIDDKLDAIEAETRETDRALRENLEKIGV